MTKRMGSGKPTLSCTKTFTVICPSPTKIALKPICQTKPGKDGTSCACDDPSGECPLDDSCAGSSCGDKHKCPTCDPCQKFMCDYYIISEKSMMYNLIFDKVYDAQKNHYVYKVTASSTPLTSGCEENNLKGYTWKAILQPVMSPHPRTLGCLFFFHTP